MGNKVIDATDMINNHPGGNVSLITKKGIDITNDYKFHSPGTQRYIRGLVVGII